jgi:hypothetical protein
MTFLLQGDPFKAVLKYKILHFIFHKLERVMVNIATSYSGGLT